MKSTYPSPPPHLPALPTCFPSKKQNKPSLEVNTINHFKFLSFLFFFFWIFVSVRGLSLVVASRGHSSSRCAGLSLSQPLLLRSTGSRHAGLVIVAHGPICSAACGNFLHQGSNPCPLHWQADSQPLRHQGSPLFFFFLAVLRGLWDLSSPILVHRLEPGPRQ